MRGIVPLFVALEILGTVSPGLALDLVDVPLFSPVTVIAQIQGVGDSDEIELSAGEPQVVSIGSYHVQLELVGGTIRAMVDQTIPSNSALTVFLYDPSLTMPSQGRAVPLVIDLSASPGTLGFDGTLGGRYTWLDFEGRGTLFVIPGDTITAKSQQIQGSSPNPAPGVPVDLIRFMTLGSPPLIGAACGLGVELAVVLPILMAIRSARPPRARRQRVPPPRAR